MSYVYDFTNGYWTVEPTKENLWSRNGTTLSPSTPGDDIEADSATFDGRVTFDNAEMGTYLSGDGGGRISAYGSSATAAAATAFSVDIASDAGGSNQQQTVKIKKDGSATFSGTVTADSFATISGDSIGGSPIGSVTMFAGATVPSGWLECNGQVAPTALAAVLGQANVPDLRGEFVRGWDNGAGVDTGRALLSSQSDEFKEHRHTIPSFNRSTATPGNDNPYRTRGGTENTSLVGGSETRPRNVALMYIIKT